MRRCGTLGAREKDPRIATWRPCTGATLTYSRYSQVRYQHKNDANRPAMTDFCKGSTIDYDAAVPGVKTERQKRVYRECGCLIGRVCTCGANNEILPEELLFCKKCKACLKNQKNFKRRGRKGRLNCENPPHERHKWMTVQIGRSTIKLNKEQADFVQEKAPQMLNLHEKGVEENSRPGRRRKFGLITLDQLKIIRKAHRQRRLEIKSWIEENAPMYEKLQKELETLQGRLYFSRSGNNKVEQYVDTLVAHGTWQRVPIEAAIQMLQGRVDVLAAKVKENQAELFHLDKVAQGTASSVIQKCIRQFLAKRKLERIRLQQAMEEKEHGAICFQRVFRGRCGRKKVRFVRNRIRQEATRKIQRCLRGAYGRDRATKLRLERRLKFEHDAASCIQNMFRSWKARQIVRTVRIEKVESAVQANIDECAASIQRIVRGYLARKKRRARKVELTLGPRVRELCNRFIAKGDLFSFLEAVNRDYELHMAQQAELRRLELENATTFIQEVLQHRENTITRKWQEWEAQKLKMRPNVRAAVSYNPEQEVDPVEGYKEDEEVEHKRLCMKKSLPQPRRARKPRKRELKNPFNQSKYELSLQQREAELYKINEKGTSRAYRVARKEPLTMKQARAVANAYRRVDYEQYFPAQQRKSKKTGQRNQIPVLDKAVVVPATKTIAYDPIQYKQKNVLLSNNRSAMDISIQSGPPRVPEHILKNTAFSGAKLLFTEIPSMNEGIEALIYHACLRTHVKALNYGGTDDSLESAFEQFVLAAPPALKLTIEEEAQQIASPHTASLRARGIHTCEDLKAVCMSLEHDFGIPTDLAETIRGLLGLLTGSLENVRPSSVQEKWRRAMNKEEKPKARKEQGTCKSRETGLPPKVPVEHRPSTTADPILALGTPPADDQHVCSERQIAMINHFPGPRPITGGETNIRPVTGDTVAYDDRTSTAGTIKHFSEGLEVDRVGISSRNSMRQIPSRGISLQSRERTPLSREVDSQGSSRVGLLNRLERAQSQSGMRFLQSRGMSMDEKEEDELKNKIPEPTQDLGFDRPVIASQQSMRELPSRACNLDSRGSAGEDGDFGFDRTGLETQGSMRQLPTRGREENGTSSLEFDRTNLGTAGSLNSRGSSRDESRQSTPKEGDSQSDLDFGRSQLDSQDSQTSSGEARNIGTPGGLYSRGTVGSRQSTRSRATTPPIIGDRPHSAAATSLLSVYNWNWEKPMELPTRLTTPQQGETINTYDLRPSTVGDCNKISTSTRFKDFKVNFALDKKNKTGDGVDSRPMSRASNVSNSSSISTGSSALSSLPPSVSRPGTRQELARNIATPMTYSDDENDDEEDSLSATLSRPKSRVSYASTIMTVDWNGEVQDRSTTAETTQSTDEEEKVSENFISRVKSLGMQLKLDDPVHGFVTLVLITSYRLDGVEYEEFLKNLTSLDINAETARREALRERYKLAQQTAEPFVKMLERAGFETIGSLAACPFESIGLPKDISDMLRTAFLEHTSPKNEHVSGRTFDSRYARGPGDKNPPGPQKPLPPIRLLRSNAVPRQSPKGQSKHAQQKLVGRVLERGERLAKAHFLSSNPANAGNGDISTSYFDWKMSNKLGHDAVVVTTDEMQAIQQWHPFLRN